MPGRGLFSYQCGRRAHAAASSSSTLCRPSSSRVRHLQWGRALLPSPLTPYMFLRAAACAISLLSLWFPSLVATISRRLLFRPVAISGSLAWRRLLTLLTSRASLPLFTILHLFYHLLASCTICLFASPLPYSPAPSLPCPGAAASHCALPPLFHYVRSDCNCTFSHPQSLSS